MVQIEFSSQAARNDTFGEYRLEGMRFLLWDFDTLLHPSLFVIFAANLQARRGDNKFKTSALTASGQF